MKNIILTIGVVITAVVLLVFGTAVIERNGAVNRENQVTMAKSNVSKEEQRRVDLFNNMVDAVESYNKYENDTQTKIAKARSQANSGKVDQAKLTLNAVTEAYPDLKSAPNYSTLMTEFSSTENRLADYRETYNSDVTDYKNYIQLFPKNITLGLTGYTNKDFKTLDYHVDNSQARNLFSK